jgi:WD40 repeat protein
VECSGNPGNGKIAKIPANVPRVPEIAGVIPTESEFPYAIRISGEIMESSTRIVTASPDKTARVWDARSGKSIGQIRHDSSVSSASFSPDGTRIITASWDNTARIWDVRSGKAIGQPL